MKKTRGKQLTSRCASMLAFSSSGVRSVRPVAAPPTSTTSSRACGAARDSSKAIGCGASFFSSQPLGVRILNVTCAHSQVRNWLHILFLLFGVAARSERNDKALRREDRLRTFTEPGFKSSSSIWAGSQRRCFARSSMKRRANIALLSGSPHESSNERSSEISATTNVSVSSSSSG